MGVAVQRSEVHILFPLFNHLVGYHLTLGKHAAVHDAVAGCADFIK